MMWDDETPAEREARLERLRKRHDADRYAGRHETKPGCFPVIIVALAVVAAVLVGLSPSKAEANHITKWDGFWWSQNRAVTSTQTLTAVWCVDQSYQRPSSIRIQNNSSQLFSYEGWFEAGTNPAIQWAYFAKNIPAHSSTTFYFPAVTKKTQAYHPRWDVWRNNVHFAYMDIWGSYPGMMTKGSATSSCG